MNPFRYKDWTNNDLYQHWVTHPLDSNHHVRDRENIPMTDDELRKVMLAIAAGLEAIETRIAQVERTIRDIKKDMTMNRMTSPTSVHDPRLYR